MNSIPQTALFQSTPAILQIEEIEPAMLESENRCSRADVLLLVFSAISAIVIQAAALSFS